MHRNFIRDVYAMSAKLIFAFGLAYADCWFSHDVANITICVMQRKALIRCTVTAQLIK